MIGHDMRIWIIKSDISSEKKQGKWEGEKKTKTESEDEAHISYTGRVRATWCAVTNPDCCFLSFPCTLFSFFLFFSFVSF
jgi:hypothetical protein